MPRYRGMRVNLLGLPLSHNAKKKIPHRERDLYYASFLSSFKKDAPKNLIVMYDVPHNLKKERDWLRRQLVNFGYVMIQKSVWVGPSPLPKEFLDYLKAIKISDNLKTFKLAKSYISHDVNKN